MAAATTTEPAAVVVVHGLWVGRWAMAWLDRRLAAGGLRVFRFGYASVRENLQANAAALARFAARIEAPRVHWLGHSLGGILIFRALSDGAGDGDGRVVMLGSPLRGSAAADRLAQFDVGRTLLGRSLLDWLAAPAHSWTLPFDLGVVAGTGGVGLGRLVAPGLARPNDGAVSVEETRISGAKEFIALPVSHSGMLVSARVARDAANFLRCGTFAAGGDAK
ncbi:MAG: alpha/beta fold hydrolase [Rhodocyclaceae bacterium]|nr:alpha/beta fold hydrolase [Rhodocyclaceae bacterium]